MTRARRELISLESTPCYHCVSRCVRRAFLHGEDRYTQMNCDHRKQCIVDRLKRLILLQGALSIRTRLTYIQYHSRSIVSIR